MSDPWTAVTQEGDATDTTDQKPLQKIPSGTQLVDAAGNTVTVIKAADGSLMARTTHPRDNSFMSDTVAQTLVPFSPGAYTLPGTNQVLSLTSDGSILSQDVAQPAPEGDIRPATDSNGNPIPGFWMYGGSIKTTEQIQALMSPGGSGGSGQLVGEVAPNPAQALISMLDYYKTQVAQGAMPREQAKEDFDRWHTIVNDQLINDQNQISAAHYQNVDQSNFDTNAINKAAGEETSLRLRAEDAQTRGTDIQKIRTTRQQDISQNILPFSVAGMGSMNIPLIGNMPLTQINPDTYGDIAGLNSIPGVPQGLQSQAPAPQAPMNIPMPSPFDPNSAPTLPAYEAPPMPNQIGGVDIQEAIRRILEGQQGRMVYG